MAFTRLPRLPKDHTEVSKIEPIPDAVLEQQREEINAAGFFSTRAAPDERRALTEQAHLPLDQQRHRKVPNAFTPDRKARFLMFLAKFGLRRRAAQYAGVSYACALNHKNSDPEFSVAWDEAHELFCEGIENEAMKRALDGWEEPVYQRGEMVGTIHRFSERMMELLLKAHLPTKYRENLKLDANVTGGVLVVPAPLSADDWEKQYGQATALPPPTIDGKAE